MLRVLGLHSNVKTVCRRSMRESNHRKRRSCFSYRAFQWAIFSSWDAESGDELNEYMICMQVLYPDGDQFGEITKAKLNIQANRRSQFNSQVIGFPVGQLGKYTVRVWIESDNKAAVQPVEIKIEVAKQEDEKPI